MNISCSHLWCFWSFCTTSRKAFYDLSNGEVLVAAGRHADAAVMYLRCALLHSDATSAPGACIEAALIHRDALDRPADARRLLLRAASLADRLGQDDVAERARDLLQTTSG